MGDIIIPKKTFGSFMLGVMVVLIFLFAFGVVMAASVFDAGGGTISNLGSPVAGSDAATRNYVDAASGGDNPGNWTCTVREQLSTNCGSNCKSTATVSCSGNEKAVSGGCSTYSTGDLSDGTYPTSWQINDPTDQGWKCKGYTSNGYVYAYANCCT